MVQRASHGSQPVVRADVGEVQGEYCAWTGEYWGFVWKSWAMDTATIAIIVTAVLSIAALSWTMLGVQRLRGNRHHLQGIGLILIPIGLWFTGVMELVVQGAEAVYRFFTDTALGTMSVTGLIVLGLGVLVFLASAIIKPIDRADSKERRQLRKQEKQQFASAQAASEQRALGGTTGSTAPARANTGAAPAAATRPSPQQPAAPKGLSSEDAEIEALLKKRGIQ